MEDVQQWAALILFQEKDGNVQKTVIPHPHPVTPA
jgi:hypothetical protein